MRSYRECPSYDKTMGKKKRNLVPDEKLCKHAVNCRPCRRCSQVPQYKLELWRKEKEPLGQSGVEGGILADSSLENK